MYRQALPLAVLALAYAVLGRLEPGSTTLHVSEAPWFCHGIDCPKFTVVNTTDDYEVRYYESGVWVSTDVETYAYAIASTTGFQRLFKYIDGGNAREEKVPMTAPVRTRIVPAAGPFCKSKFTVSFFVPFDVQKDPPKPSNPDVYINPQPAFTAFVSQFGGFAMDDWSIGGKARALAKALDEAGVEYEADWFWYAQYDPPFRLTGRHNEVWMVAKEAAPQQ